MLYVVLEKKCLALKRRCHKWLISQFKNTSFIWHQTFTYWPGTKNEIVSQVTRANKHWNVSNFSSCQNKQMSEVFWYFHIKVFVEIPKKLTHHGLLFFMAQNGNRVCVTCQQTIKWKLVGINPVIIGRSTEGFINLHSETSNMWCSASTDVEV